MKHYTLLVPSSGWSSICLGSYSEVLSSILGWDFFKFFYTINIKFWARPNFILWPHCVFEFDIPEINQWAGSRPLNESQLAPMVIHQTLLLLLLVLLLYYFCCCCCSPTSHLVFCFSYRAAVYQDPSVFITRFVLGCFFFSPAPAWVTDLGPLASQWPRGIYPAAL